jgi:hypothetical protein
MVEDQDKEQAVEVQEDHGYERLLYSRDAC